jgi:hypothetical protein
MLIPSLILSLALLVQTASEPPPYRLIRLLDHVPEIKDGDDAGGGDAIQFVRAGGDDGFPFTRPVVELAAYEDMRPVAVSVAFNWVRLGEGPERRPVWFARLRARNHSRSIERYADGRECPAVQQTLDQLGGLPPPDLKAPQPPSLSDIQRIEGRGYLHDNTYQVRVRGQAWASLSTHEVRLTGGSEAPFARIIGESLTELMPCWTEAPPPTS